MDVEQPPRSPAAELLGREVLHVARGEVRVAYRAREAFLNRNGRIQGGLLAAMLDSAMGIAAASVVDDGVRPVTIEIKVSFVRPAGIGRVLADARVVHAGSTVLFLEGALRDEHGALIATATATSRLIPAGGER